MHIASICINSIRFLASTVSHASAPQDIPTLLIFLLNCGSLSLFRVISWGIRSSKPVVSTHGQGAASEPQGLAPQLARRSRWWIRWGTGRWNEYKYTARNPVCIRRKRSTSTAGDGEKVCCVFCFCLWRIIHIIWGHIISTLTFTRNYKQVRNIPWLGKSVQTEFLFLFSCNSNAANKECFQKDE